MGNKQSELEYTVNEIPLHVDEKERQLGVKFHKSLKCCHHIATGEKKANWVLRMIKRSFKNHSKIKVYKLCKSGMPTLEYCVQAWRPYQSSLKEFRRQPPNWCQISPLYPRRKCEGSGKS